MATVLPMKMTIVAEGGALALCLPWLGCAVVASVKFYVGFNTNFGGAPYNLLHITGTELCSSF